MTRLALVSEHFGEALRGATARCLAELFAARGHRVVVLTRRDGPPAPRLGLHGRIETHRLDIRPGAPAASFAIESARRLREIARAHDLEAVECVDAPEACAAIGLLGGERPPATPVIDVVVDPTRSGAAIPLAAIGADGVIAMSDAALDQAARVGRAGAARFVVPPPAEPAPSIGPDDACDLFVLLGDPSAASAGHVARAFVRSAAAREGWAVATPSAPGRWLVSVAPTAARPEGHRPQRVPIFTGRSDRAWHEIASALPVLAAGVAPIIASSSPLAAWLPTAHRASLVYEAGSEASLAERIAEAAQRSASDRSAVARAVSAHVSARTDPERVAAGHRRAWEAAREAAAERRRPAAEHLAAWRALEQRLAQNAGQEADHDTPHAPEAAR